LFPDTGRELLMTTRFSRPLRQAIALVGIVAAFALSGTSRAADTSSHAVRVFAGGGRVATVFTSANCGVNHFGFIAIGHSDGYVLYVHADPFTGFHHYQLARGQATGVYVEVKSPAGTRHASDFVPPYPVPGGGALNFGDHGKLMGVGFHPMFSEDGSDAVTMAGVLNCKYAKKRHRGK
jgi:hypothetical protein